MKKTIHTKEKPTLNRSILQLKMNFNTELCFEDDGKVGLVQNLVERMDLSKLINVYCKLGRKPIVDPITMLKVLIFCYSEGVYSSRKIEKSCKVDLRLRYLLEDQKAPDHATINRYRQKLEPFIEEIFFKNTEILLENDQIDLSSIYIDGTKIEAYANKYSFAWKKSILKYQDKLRTKINTHFDLDIETNLSQARNYLNRKFYEISNKSKDVKFVYGKGKRKTQIQRDYELYNSWLEKLAEYKHHLDIMGERNSYSKTDHDATFMRMKDDHMMNGQLKAGYNIQLASSGQYIVGVYGSHYANDIYTLPLFLDKLYPRYNRYLDRIVCDSCYESIENYTYLKEHKLVAYVKPSNYELSKKRRYRKDISKKENMIYVEESDYYICANSKKLVREKDIVRIKKSGFKETNRVYKCYECNNCPYQKTCNKYSKKKTLKLRVYSLMQNLLSLEKNPMQILHLKKELMKD